MARSNSIKFLRTSRANLNTQATSAALLAGEPYLITDENRLAWGLSASTYETAPTKTEFDAILNRLAPTGGTVGQVIRKNSAGIGDFSWYSLVKADVGLGNVDNTSDVNKPVSTAQQSALNLKLNATAYTAADVLAKIKAVDGAGSGLDADTVDGHEASDFYRTNAAHTTSGNLIIQNGAAQVVLSDTARADRWRIIQNGSFFSIQLDPLGDNNWIGQLAMNTNGALTYQSNAVYHAGAKPTKADVGLGSVDNTSDLAKPLSTAQQAYVDTWTFLPSRVNVAAATTGNITLSGLQTIDGIAVAEGQRVLVRNQTNLVENGIYRAQTGAWNRDQAANSWFKLFSQFAYVLGGATWSGTTFVASIVAGGTIDVTNVSYSQVSNTSLDQSTGLLPDDRLTGGTYAPARMNVTSIAAYDLLAGAPLVVGAPVNSSGNSYTLLLDKNTIQARFLTANGTQGFKSTLNLNPAGGPVSAGGPIISGTDLFTHGFIMAPGGYDAGVSTSRLAQLGNGNIEIQTGTALTFSTSNPPLSLQGSAQQVYVYGGQVYNTLNKPSKADVGLANVDNTSDADKPVSTATSAYAQQRVENTTTLNFGQNMGAVPINLNFYAQASTSTINASIVRANGANGAMTITNNGSGAFAIVNGAGAFTYNGNAVYHAGNKPSKSDVGLGNVDNTSDANKPVSSATQTALNLKANLAGPTFTGVVSVLASDYILLQGEQGDTGKLKFKSRPVSPTWIMRAGGVGNDGQSLFFLYDSNDDGTSDATALRLRGDTSTLEVFGGTVYHTLNKPTKADVGLDQVDNTSDANKPVSTTVQTALNGKVDNGSYVGNLAMATNRILGRSSSGSGAVEEITLGANLTLSAGVLNVVDPLVVSTTAEATATAPSTGNVKLMARDMAGRGMIGALDSYGDKHLFGTHLGRNNYAWWRPLAGATTIPVGMGIPAPTSVGSPAARTPTSTSIATRAHRLGYTTSATAGSLCGHYFNANWWTTGGGPTTPMGGFHLFYRFVISDPAAVTGARMFVGLSNSVAAPTNVEPSAMMQCIGVAQLSTSGNLCIVHAGNTLQTPIDLGANFPATAGEMYELQLFASPNLDRAVGWRVERLNTGQVASGLQQVQAGAQYVPISTTFLSPRAWRTNNTTALAVGLDIVNLVIESDN